MKAIALKIKPDDASVFRAHMARLVCRRMERRRHRARPAPAIRPATPVAESTGVVRREMLPL